MSNLDVSLRLRLVNQLAGPAKDAKRELEGVGAAAKKLDGAKAGKLAADLAKTKNEAKGADAALSQASTSARKLGAAKADKLARDLAKTRTEALAGMKALAQFNTQLQKLDGGHVDRLVQGLRNATAQSERLARGLRRVRDESRGAGQGGSGGGALPPTTERRGQGGGALPAVIGMGARAAGVVGGVYAGVRVAGAVKQSFQDFAELDRRMTRLGITAEATKAQVDAATGNVRAIARQYAVPVEEVLKGLEALVAQGKELPEALAMMDAVVKSAQASGASAEDMSNSAGAMMTNLKLKVEELPEAFDRLAYAGKKGQFELKDMARYFPELAAAWANVGQKGAGKLADLAAATQIIRKEAGTSEKTFNGIRDLLAKINTTDVQNNFKKMGVDLEAGLKKGAKEGKPLLDVIIELTEKALKGDMAKLPKLFGEIDSRTAISALINLKAEFRSLRAEIQTKALGTINTDVVRLTGDAQASIDKLADSWSAAGIAVGKFVAEATPAVGLLERLSRGIDSAREYLSGDKKDDSKKDAPRVDEPAGPKSQFSGRMQSYEHARATRAALNARRPKLSDFSGRFQSQNYAKALAQWEREQRSNKPLRGPATPIPEVGNYSPVPSFKPPAIGRRQAAPADPRNYSPVPPVAASVAETTMQRISRAVASESAKAVAESQSAAERIRAMWNFQVSPQISPRFSGPAASGAPAGGASSAPRGPASAPAPESPRKQAGLAGGRTVHVTVHVNGAGRDGSRIGQDIARQLAQLGDSSSALFDTV
ncbi:TP901 family phage tail tape measure protein [Rhodopseudomonas rhenobacensis]|uniref:TP901 family phage tail tape measure protein n=1 Tax=Rhodopseudomonas rhenobacensis TaxID=87461 RepID=A0A7W8DYC7_9BRAD|nr:phage tail tape measure protein [Rhodopseudomonas rhenobacensis]MBB5046803.1 TP901 family phage tail tape measure protein [Rhodopseudomonas rhenobacensis]